jgi:hypothetical protein
MARRYPRPAATQHQRLMPLQEDCPHCGQRLWVAAHSERTVLTLAGLVHFTLVVRWCRQRTCPRYHRPFRPEAEGAIALPKGELGLDVIALVGTLRFAEHRSVPEIHRILEARGLHVAQRSVTNLIYRYEELVALSLVDRTRLHDELITQGQVILAIDGLQPDVGHEVLWVLRDCISGEILLARSLLSGREAELVTLLQEVATALPVPIRAVISDGQQSIRKAVQSALPGVPHQLCQFHYLREAATPIYEADRHAKKELKKRVRGVRPIARLLAARTDPAAEAMRAYCLAVRSALTDDGQPPLEAAGLRLQARMEAIVTSLGRIAQATGGCHANWRNSSGCWRAGWRPRHTCGPTSGRPLTGSTRRRRSWRTRRSTQARMCVRPTRN